MPDREELDAHVTEQVCGECMVYAQQQPERRHHQTREDAMAEEYMALVSQDRHDW